MDAHKPQLEVIFHEALARTDAGERAAYLDATCGSDAGLRQRVEDLLAAYAERGAFLGGTDNATLSAAREKIAAGEVIGQRYKLLEAIGEGGMGTVFMAEQTAPVRRLVALKVIKPGMDSKAVLARFEAERQALALMDHPNIAKVLDAGATANGRPFFVMELVKGTPITKFCDERKLSPRERLELFVPVCLAIQHAHQKGVIHRDIKPSNVLVALYDGHPVPKVIDFGVAKAAGQPLTEKTLHTGFGAILGTPEYMSPEQATFNQLDIDTRSDVYALGVLLYELLTGTTPVDKSRFTEAALLEVLRVVREEDPPRPSVKLTTSDTRAGIAAIRGMQPDKLSKLLRGELDWIVMKALEKDRNRRYDTAAGLAKDVQRYLADEMVEARPPSFRYRALRFVRKNTATLLVGWLVFCLLVGWFATARNSMLRQVEATNRALAAQFEAVREKNEAEKQRADALAAKEDADNQRRQAIEQRGLALAAKMEASEAAQKATRAFEQAKENEQKANKEARRAEQSEKDAKAAADDAKNAVLETLATTNLYRVSVVGKTIDQFLKTIKELEKIGNKLDNPTARLLGSFSVTLGFWYSSNGKEEEGSKWMNKGLATYRAHGGLSQPMARNDAQFVALIYQQANRLDAAAMLFDELLTAVKGKTDLSDSEVLAMHMTAAGVYKQVGRYADAVPLLQDNLRRLEAIREQRRPPGIGVSLNITLQNLGECTLKLGASLLSEKQYAEAEQVLLGYVEMWKSGKKFDANFIRPDVPEAVKLLVRLYDETKQPDKAAAWRKRLTK